MIVALAQSTVKGFEGMNRRLGTLDMKFNTLAGHPIEQKLGIPSPQ